MPLSLLRIRSHCSASQIATLTTRPQRHLGGSKPSLSPSPPTPFVRVGTILLIAVRTDEGGSPSWIACLAARLSTRIGSDSGRPVPSHKRRNALGVRSLTCSGGCGIIAVTMAMRSPFVTVRSIGTPAIARSKSSTGPTSAIEIRSLPWSIGCSPKRWRPQRQRSLIRR